MFTFRFTCNPLTFTTLIFVAGIKTASSWSSLTLATSPWRVITLALWLTLSTRVRTPASWGRRTRFWQPIRGSYGCVSEDVKPQYEIVLTETTDWFCPKWVLLSFCHCVVLIFKKKRRKKKSVIKCCICGKGEQMRSNQRLMFTTAPWNLTYSGTYSSRFIHKAINILMSGVFCCLFFKCKFVSFGAK